MKLEGDRMWDLVRFMRSELHTEGLITDEEYTALAFDHPAVARLESYDEMHREINTLRKDKTRLEYALDKLFILDYVPGGGCHRIYTTREEIDTMMDANKPRSGRSA